MALALIVLGLASCSMFRKNTDGNDKKASIFNQGSRELALIYNPIATTLHPKVFVKKQSDNDIDIYYLISDNELLFSKANAEGAQQAQIRIYYKIMESYEKPDLLDSCERVMTIKKSDFPRTYAIKLKVKPVDLQKFVVMSTVTDLVRQKMSLHFCEVDRKSPFVEDNYTITDPKTMQPRNVNYIKKGEVVRIDYNRYFDYPILYGGDTEMEPFTALSPYASDPATEDSTVFGSLTMRDKSFMLSGNECKLYMTTADTNYKENLIIPCFREDYPNINTLDDLIKPVAYLATGAEYEKLQSSKTKKLDLDEFWYSCGEDIKRSKELIKVYYTRAVLANIYFCDTREGSQTDRGMVYIVLGPPDILAITSTSEIWTYRDKRSGQNIKFVFRRQTNALGERYVLRRSTELKTFWDRAVNSWRKGKIF